uniref:Uncharacterized protein n=1 Tax=Amphiprion ocellaris TaxID=80972 RepID=A0A3Q1BA42_AMPOC
MYPQSYPSALVPLQGVPYGQSEHPGIVQHTTVNIIAEPPKDHIIWSIFSLFYMNSFCLGLAALIHSIKARDRKMVGDLPEARWYRSTVRSLNIAATVATCVIVLIFIITFSIFMCKATSQCHRHHHTK